MALKNSAFKNIVEKGENAGNQHFLLFPQCFYCIKAKSNQLSFIATFDVICKWFQCCRFKNFVV